MSRAAVFAFANQLPRLKDPGEVVDRLLQDVAVPARLGVLAIWRRSTDPTRWADYVIGQSLFPGNVAPEFWTDYFELVQKHGLTATQKMAWQIPGQPFTLTEAMIATGATRGDRWVFDLFRDYKIRDGLYCPVGRWIVAYTSPTLLRLAPATRGHLFYAASQAAFHIEGLRPKRKQRRGPTLSKRERSVLGDLSGGERPHQIAERIGVSEATVREYVRRAQVKLGGRTTTQTVAIAIRAMLI